MTHTHSMRGCHCPTHEKRRTYTREYERRRYTATHQRQTTETYGEIAARRTLIEQRIALGWSDQGIADVLDRPIAEVASVRLRMDELVGT